MAVLHLWMLLTALSLVPHVNAELRFTASEKGFIVPIVGDSVELDCQTNTPSAYVTLWLYTGVNNAPASRVIPSDRIIQTGQKFTINKISLNDNGQYICRAAKDSEKVELKVGMIIASSGGYQNPTVNVFPTQLNLNKGDTLNISCRALGDGVTLTWQHCDNAVPSNSVVIMKPKRVNGFTVHQLTLLVSHVSKSDEGSYTCQLITGLKPGYKHSLTASVLVNDPVALKWLISPFGFHRISAEDTMIISCETSRPLHEVRLGFRFQNGKVTERKVDGSKVQKACQDFIIKDIQLADSGDYYCMAEGLSQIKLGMLYVDTTGRLKPNPTLSTTSAYLHFGDNFNITCSEIGATIQLDWLKLGSDGKEVQVPNSQVVRTRKREKGTITQVATLMLTSITQADQATYKCQLTHFSGTTSAIAVVQMKDLVAPVIRGWKATVTVNEGSPLALRCRFVSRTSPLPSIKWLKDGNLISECSGSQYTSCQRFIKDDAFSLSYKVLTITKTDYFHAGKYTCRQENLKGKDEKSMTVFVNAKPELNKSEDRLFADKSEIASVRCLLIKSRPLSKATWRYQPWPCIASQECQPKPDKWEPLPTVNHRTTEFVLIDGVYVSTVTVQPSTNQGFYQCNATNSLGVDTHAIGLRRLVLTKTLSVQPSPTYQVNEQSKLELTCQAKRGLFDEMFWMFSPSDGSASGVKLVLNSRVSFETSRTVEDVFYKLIIDPVNLGESGKYTCYGQQLGGKTFTAGTSVAVVALVEPAVSLANYTVTQPKDVTIYCTTQGNPLPLIEWFLNGQLITNIKPILKTTSCEDSLPGYYKFQGTKEWNIRELIVCKATHMKHTGWYECRATNSQGSDMDQGYLDVLAPPEIQPLEDEGRVVVALGSTVSVKCEAHGNPTPVVKWYKLTGNGTKEPVYEYEEGTPQTSVLGLYSLEEEHFGNYVCVAENDLNTVEKSLSLVQSSGGSVLARIGTPDGISNNALYGIIASSGICILILLVVVVVLYRRRQLYGGFYILTTPPPPDYLRKLDPSKSLLEQTHKLPYDPEWEFPRERIQIIKPLGAGAFGEVFMATAVGIVAFDPRGSVKRKSGRRRSRLGSNKNPYVNCKQATTVAVKTLKETASESDYKDLISELKILIHIGEHKNIVNLLGSCTKGKESELWVIMEYCPHGNLLDFLRNRRDIFDPKWTSLSKDPNSQWTIIDLINATYQVARGMDFLNSRRCIHRDLAARNVLVGEDHVMKIADFGLARDIYKEDQYIKNTSGLLPVKWMAIEALWDRVYTSKSDVWSFGILMWELFTLGGTPYPGIPASEVYQFLVEGRRMEQPAECPLEVYAIMRDCWLEDPEERPAFTVLVEKFDKIIERNNANEGGDAYLDLVEDGYLKSEDIHYSIPSTNADNMANEPLPALPTNEEDDVFEPDADYLNEKRGGNNKEYIPMKLRKSNPDMEAEKVQKDLKEREKRDSGSVQGSQASSESYVNEKEKDNEDDDEKDRDSLGGNFEMHMAKTRGHQFDNVPNYINS